MFTGQSPQVLLDPANDDVTDVFLDRMLAASDKNRERDLSEWARGKL